MGEKILKWKCDKCTKEIKSIYIEQFEYNKKRHIETHEKKDGQ